MYKNIFKIIWQMILYGMASFYLGIITLSMGFGAIMEMVGSADFGSENPSDSTLVRVLVAMFLVLTIICIKGFMRPLHALRIARYLEKDEDGLLDSNQLSASMKMKHDKFMKIFIDCVSRELLFKCSLYAEDPTMIQLDNGKNDIRKRYAVLHCESCSAPNAVRLGFKQNCKYCGNAMAARQ